MAPNADDPVRLRRKNEPSQLTAKSEDQEFELRGYKGKTIPKESVRIQNKVIRHI